MSSKEEYLIYVLDLLRETDGITYKKMMGEYILYKDDIIFGGIYDDRFLIKKTKSSSVLGLKEEIPYPSSKPMYLINSEDTEEIKRIVENLIIDLKKD